MNELLLLVSIHDETPHKKKNFGDTIVGLFGHREDQAMVEARTILPPQSHTATERVHNETTQPCTAHLKKYPTQRHTTEQGAAYLVKYPTANSRSLHTS